MRPNFQRSEAERGFGMMAVLVIAVLGSLFMVGLLSFIGVSAKIQTTSIQSESIKHSLPSISQVLEQPLLCRSTFRSETGSAIRFNPEIGGDIDQNYRIDLGRLAYGLDQLPIIETKDSYHARLSKNQTHSEEDQSLIVRKIQLILDYDRMSPTVMASQKPFDFTGSIDLGGVLNEVTNETGATVNVNSGNYKRFPAKLHIVYQKSSEVASMIRTIKFNIIVDQDSHYIVGCERVSGAA